MAVHECEKCGYTTSLKAEAMHCPQCVVNKQRDPFSDGDFSMDEDSSIADGFNNWFENNYEEM